MLIKNQNIKLVFTISVFLAMSAVVNMVLGVFPQLFHQIAIGFGLDASKLGIISAVNILVTSLSSIAWGYWAGKYNRKKLIVVGMIFWSASVFLTSHCTNYLQLFVLQAFTGLGLGCIASIGYSVLTDYIPQKYRGTLLSLWGVSQGLGIVAGSLMVSITVNGGAWRRPFEILGAAGFPLILLCILIDEPAMGGSDPELKEVIEKGLEYNYKIEFKHIINIASKRSNAWLYLQGFFMNITIGTLIWLPTLFILKIEQQGVSSKTAITASGYLFAFLQVGGLSSAYFGYLGDIAQRHSFKGRAMLSAFLAFISIPFFITMCVLPMNKLSLPNYGSFEIFIGLIKEISLNPWITAIFLVAFMATAAKTANTPNYLALITDINLPEHRSAVFSLANLINGIGRAIGSVGISFVISIFSKHTAEPNNYIFSLILFQLFIIPSAFSYIKMSKYNEEDISCVKSILRQRADKSDSDL